MIDIENEVYSGVYNVVKERYPNIFIAGEYVAAPAYFPCLTLVEVINSVYMVSSTNDEIENHSLVTYEVNVYSNKTTGKKTECKNIIKLVDDKMASFGFVRRFLQSVPNINDATIYRMFGRYQAVVDKNKTIYRR